jgi:hypothetical protein
MRVSGSMSALRAMRCCNHFPGIVASSAHMARSNAHPSSRARIAAQAAPNIAFKPKLHRYANNMADKACHVVGYALQFGLT